MKYTEFLTICLEKMLTGRKGGQVKCNLFGPESDQVRFNYIIKFIQDVKKGSGNYVFHGLRSGDIVIKYNISRDQYIESTLLWPVLSNIVIDIFRPGCWKYLADTDTYR